MNNIIQVMRIFVSVGTLIVQVLAIKKQIEICIWFRERSKANIEKLEPENKKSTHKEVEVPEWVEKLIDDYMANPAKDSCR